jgi:hypothetical protein
MKRLALFRYRPLKWGLFLLLVAVIVVLALQLTGTIHLLSKTTKPTATTGGANTKGVSKTPPKKKDSNSNGSSANTTTVPPTSTSTSKLPPSSGANLAAPWGTFANVYNARLNQQMGSTCNTTPGATCEILFTNGAQTKSLKAETADAGGAVYWSWTPAGIGLVPGTWHITAKAVLGSQTKTTSNDPLVLTITQ